MEIVITEATFSPEDQSVSAKVLSYAPIFEFTTRTCISVLKMKYLWQETCKVDLSNIPEWIS